MRYCWAFCIDNQNRRRTVIDLIGVLLDDVPNRKLLKPLEVAGLFGVSVKTIYRWCDMGLMESVKLNGSVRVLRASVIGFLRKVEPAD
jgi:predicted DNA-binding transcriptional regulator AlpA